MLSKESLIKWIHAAGIRAIKTMAQAAIGVIGAATVWDEVSWMYVLSASALAGIVSLLTSIAGLPELKLQGEEPFKLKRGK